MNSDGESYVLFRTFGGVFLTSKRIVANVGKSHITVEKVKLPALKTPSNIEVFVGQLGERKDSRYALHSLLIRLCSNKQPLIIHCLQNRVGEMRKTKRRWPPCAHEPTILFISSMFHKNRDTLLLLTKYNFQKVEK